MISKVELLKYVMSKVYHNTCTTKWIMLLLEFNLIFIIQNFIKDQVIIDQLVEVPIQATTPLKITLPDEDMFNIDEIE